jgi:hypothetical protein
MAQGASDMKQWARLGAVTRLRQMDTEREAILKAFPDLRRGVAVSASLGARPKRQMSAKARKAMSDGMRKYWAKRRAAGK